MISVGLFTDLLLSVCVRDAKQPNSCVYKLEMRSPSSPLQAFSPLTDSPTPKNPWLAPKLMFLKLFCACHLGILLKIQSLPRYIQGVVCKPAFLTGPQPKPLPQVRGPLLEEQGSTPPLVDPKDITQGTNTVLHWCAGIKYLNFMLHLSKNIKSQQTPLTNLTWSNVRLCEKEYWDKGKNKILQLRAVDSSGLTCSFSSLLKQCQETGKGNIKNLPPPIKGGLTVQNNKDYLEYGLIVFNDDLGSILHLKIVYAYDFKVIIPNLKSTYANIIWLMGCAIRVWRLLF